MPARPVTKSDATTRAWRNAVVAIIAVLGALWWPVIRPLWQKNKARHDVKELALGLKAYSMAFGILPEGSRAEICAVLSGKNVRGQNPKQEPVVEGYDLNVAGEFLDPWGEPYQIFLEKGIRVYSCGPNRRDEQGQGDDILPD